jgi:hypothetical protein
VDFHGEKRSNQTHESKADPDAKLARKDEETRSNYRGKLLVENRCRVIVATTERKTTVALHLDRVGKTRDRISAEETGLLLRTNVLLSQI